MKKPITPAASAQNFVGNFYLWRFYARSAKPAGSGAVALAKALQLDSYHAKRSNKQINVLQLYYLRLR